MQNSGSIVPMSPTEESTRELALHNQNNQRDINVSLEMSTKYIVICKTNTK